MLLQRKALAFPVPCRFYASQSAYMNCYFTCQKLSKFSITCFTTTKETVLAHPVLQAAQYMLTLNLDFKVTG